MSILAFGDLHLSKDPLRILTVMNFLDYIHNYCIEHEIKNVVNLGDLLHTPELNSNAFVPVFRKLFNMSKDVHIYSILGNHEIKNKDGNDTLIETFSSFGTFIQKSQTINIDGMDYDFLSYTEDVTSIPNKSRVLFGHLEVEGFYYNPNRKIDGSYFTPDLFDQYNLVVSGHLHHEQHRDNFEFVGSPFATNKGEGGKQNYFAVIDGSTCELIPYNEGPDYITIDVNKFNEDIDYRNKIVTVQIDKKVENFVKLRDILLDRGALEIIPQFIKEEVEDTGEHKVDTNEGVVKSAAKYLQEVKAPNIDNNKLLSCFKEVLKRV